MELLSKLTPAETLLIIQSSKAKYSDLLRFTLMDLLLRGVLEIHQSPKQKAGNPIASTFVMTGKNFRAVTPPLHEMVFLYPFYKNEKKPVSFRMLLRIGYSQAKNVSTFKENYILKSANLNGLFKRGRWQKFWSIIALSEAGKKVREEIVMFFNKLDKTLPKNLEKDEAKAAEVIQMIKGNILLLNCFQFKLTEIIAREFATLDNEVEQGSPE